MLDSFIKGSSVLCSGFEQLSVIHRRHFIQLLLPSFVVVEVYVGFNSCYQAVVILEAAKIVHFAFENPPKSLHGAIIDATTNARHTLYHSSLVQSRFKLLTGVLKTSVL